jgi:hypothetical protein
MSVVSMDLTIWGYTDEGVQTFTDVRLEADLDDGELSRQCVYLATEVDAAEAAWRARADGTAFHVDEECTDLWPWLSEKARDEIAAQYYKRCRQAARESRLAAEADEAEDRR